MYKQVHATHLVYIIYNTVLDKHPALLLYNWSSSINMVMLSSSTRKIPSSFTTYLIVFVVLGKSAHSNLSH